MSRIRNTLTAAGVGIAGVIGGGVLATTASANANAAETGDHTAMTSLIDRGAGSNGAESRGPCEGGPGGHRGVPVDEAISDQVEQAVLGAYAGATVDRVAETGTDSDGQPIYQAHVRTAEGEFLHVVLDDGFVITGAEERPGPGEPGEGYWARVRTADGTILHVLLVESLAVTDTEEHTRRMPHPGTFGASGGGSERGNH